MTDSGKLGKYLHGKVSSILIRNSIPMIFGIGAAIALSVIDTVFIARLGTEPLAAITFTFPVIFIAIGVTFGLGTGASAVISRAIGEGNYHKVRRLTTDSILLSLIVVALFIIAGLFFLEDIFRLNGAGPNLMPYIRDYMYIWIPGVIFLVTPLIGNYATRATGDTKTPSKIMAVTVIMNLLLDPLLIFGWGPVPALGVKGAAIASITARIVTTAVSFRILYFRDKMITFEKPAPGEIAASWKEILFVGLPAVATNLIVPVGFSIVLKMVSAYGKEAVAAVGAASRIDTFVLVVFMAMAGVLGPFIGQNLGAAQHGRIREALKQTFVFSFIWGGCVFILFQLFAFPLAKIIKEDMKVVEVITLYLHIIPVSLAFRGVIFMCTTALNIYQKPVWSSLLSISQVFILFIPLALLYSGMMGLSGIFWASVTSSVLTSGGAYYLLSRVLKRHDRDFPAVAAEA